jgi:hypothetical protein
MNPATEQFKFPFDSGEPLILPVTNFFYKTTYDKFYVLNIDDFLARGEVLQNAIKNTSLILTQQVLDMGRKSEHIDIDTSNARNKQSFYRQSVLAANMPSGSFSNIPSVTFGTAPQEEKDEVPPECFGVFLGKFIPFASDIHGLEFNKKSLNEIRDLAMMWSKEFFEMYLEYWLLVMINPEYPSDKVKSVAGKPVWIKLTKSQFLPLWEARYQHLLGQGLLTRSPDFERNLVAHKQMAYPDDVAANQVFMSRFAAPVKP